MSQYKNKFKSIRVKLFLTLCVVVIIIIAFLIITNNFVLETFYLYSKQKNLMLLYDKSNEVSPVSSCSGVISSILQFRAVKLVSPVICSIPDKSSGSWSFSIATSSDVTAAMSASVIWESLFPIAVLTASASRGSLKYIKLLFPYIETVKLNVLSEFV